MKTFKELGYRKIQGYEDYEIMYREEGEGNESRRGRLLKGNAETV